MPAHPTIQRRRRLGAVVGLWGCPLTFIGAPGLHLVGHADDHHHTAHGIVWHDHGDGAHAHDLAPDAEVLTGPTAAGEDHGDGDQAHLALALLDAAPAPGVFSGRAPILPVQACAPAAPDQILSPPWLARGPPALRA